MKIRNAFLIILSFVIVATGMHAACPDEHENKQAQTTDHSLRFSRWSTPELLELASLIKEQRHWITMADACINKPSADTLAAEGITFEYYVVQQVVERMRNTNFGGLNISDDQKEKGLFLFFGLYNCSAQYVKGSTYKQFTEILAHYTDIAYLAPLREVTALIPNDNRLENVKIAQKMIIEYNEKVAKINIIMRTFKQTYNMAKSAFEAIVRELIKRSHGCESFSNIFTGIAFILPQNISPSTASIEPSQLSVSFEKQLADLQTAAKNMAENKTSPAIETLRKEHLHEIASLLYEQGNFIQALEIMCLRRQKIASEFFVVASQCVSAMRRDRSELQNLLTTHCYKELAPLQKLLELHDILTARFNTTNGDSTKIQEIDKSAPLLNGIISTSKEIIDQHDALYSPIYDTYKALASTLVKLKPARRWRLSICSGSYLPTIYCGGHRPVAPAIIPTEQVTQMPTAAPTPLPPAPAITQPAPATEQAVPAAPAELRIDLKSVFGNDKKALTTQLARLYQGTPDNV